MVSCAQVRVAETVVHRQARGGGDPGAQDGLTTRAMLRRAKGAAARKVPK